MRDNIYYKSSLQESTNFLDVAGIEIISERNEGIRPYIKRTAGNEVYLHIGNGNLIRLKDEVQGISCLKTENSIFYYETHDEQYRIIVRHNLENELGDVNPLKLTKQHLQTNFINWKLIEWEEFVPTQITGQIRPLGDFLADNAINYILYMDEYYDDEDEVFCPLVIQRIELSNPVPAIAVTPHRSNKRKESGESSQSAPSRADPRTTYKQST